MKLFKESILVIISTLMVFSLISCEKDTKTTTNNNLAKIEVKKEDLYSTNKRSQIATANSQISNISNPVIDLMQPPAPLVGAKADGTDETIIIQNILNLIPDNSVLRIPPKTFRISNYLTITKKLTIIGYGAKFTYTDSPEFGTVGQCFIYANSVSNIRIEGLSFDGRKSVVPKDSKCNTAIWLEDCQFAKVVNCVAYNLNGLGSNLNTAFAFVDQSLYGEAIGNIVHDSDCGAIFMQGGGSKILNNRAYNLTDIGFVFNAPSCYNSLIKGNYADNCAGGGIGIENGPYNILISNNKVKNIPNGYGIGVLSIGGTQRSKNIVINGNTVDRNSGTNPCGAISVIYCDHYTVSNNIITNYDTRNIYNSGITLRGTNGTASNNKITVDCQGIDCSGSYFNINKNRITSNRLYGIYFPDTTTKINCSGNIINSSNTGIAGLTTADINGIFISNKIIAKNNKKYELGNVEKSTSIKILD